MPLNIKLFLILIALSLNAPELPEESGVPILSLDANSVACLVNWLINQLTVLP
jgi:hypothetical protein